MIEDAGDRRPAARRNTCAFARLRSGVSTCNTTEQDKLAKRLLPSGHTSIGWATALVLAEINPQRQNEEARLSSASRVICGYHWQSDVDAARIVGSAVVATLHPTRPSSSSCRKPKTNSRKGRSNVIAVAFPDAAPGAPCPGYKTAIDSNGRVVGRVRREPPPA